MELLYLKVFNGRKVLFLFQNDPRLLRAVGNGDRMLRRRFFVISKCLGKQTPDPGPQRVSKARVLPGGMLAAGIDSHINSATNVTP